MNPISPTLIELLKACAHKPKDASLQKQLAECYFQMNQFEEAEEAYLKVLHLDHQNLSAKIGLGISFVQNKKYREANIILEEILKADTLPPEGLILKAYIAFLNNQIEEAKEAYFDALESNSQLMNKDFEKKLFKKLRKNLPAEERFSEIDPVMEDLDVSAEIPSENFSHIGGYLDIKKIINLKMVFPQIYPETYEGYSKNPGGSILLYGPPGCGKSLIAKAAAGEAQIPLIEGKVHEIINPAFGIPHQNQMQFYFQSAKDFEPCVLLFDDLDLLNKIKTVKTLKQYRPLVSQFTAQLETSKHEQNDILTIACTSLPWNLEEIVFRTGRFENVIFVAPPSLEDRAQILKTILKKFPNKELNFGELATMTPLYSGSDLEALVLHAVESKIALSIKRHQGQIVPLEMNDFKQSMNIVQASTLSWFRTAKQHKDFLKKVGIYKSIKSFWKNY